MLTRSWVFVLAVLALDVIGKPIPFPSNEHHYALGPSLGTSPEPLHPRATTKSKIKSTSLTTSKPKTKSSLLPSSSATASGSSAQVLPSPIQPEVDALEKADTAEQDKAADKNKPTDLNLHLKEPKYTEFKKLVCTRREDFFKNEKLKKDLESYDKADQKHKYSLKGLVPANLVNNSKATNGHEWGPADSLFTNYADHYPANWILSSTDESYIIGSLPAFDTRLYDEKWDPKAGTGAKLPVASMSYFHLMVIPKTRIYTTVTMDKSELKIFDEMTAHFKSFWKKPDAIKLSVARINLGVDIRADEIRKTLQADPNRRADIPEFTKMLSEVKKTSRQLEPMLQKLSVEDKSADFYFGVHPYPKISVGYLHMHVLATSAEMRKYSTGAKDGYQVPVKGAVEAINQDCKFDGN